MLQIILRNYTNGPKLIDKGRAYVDSQTSEEIAQQKGHPQNQAQKVPTEIDRSQKTKHCLNK